MPIMILGPAIPPSQVTNAQHPGSSTRVHAGSSLHLISHVELKLVCLLLTTATTILKNKIKPGKRVLRVFITWRWKIEKVILSPHVTLDLKQFNQSKIKPRIKIKPQEYLSHSLFE